MRFLLFITLILLTFGCIQDKKLPKDIIPQNEMRKPGLERQENLPVDRCRYIVLVHIHRQSCLDLLGLPQQIRNTK